MHGATMKSIVIPSTPGLPCGLVPWDFPTKSLYTPLLSPIPPTFPIRLVFLHFITRIIFDEECRFLSSSLWSFLYSPATSSLLGPNFPLNTLLSNTLILRSSLNTGDHNWHPYQTKGKIIILYVLLFLLLDRQLEDKIFCTELLQAFPDFILLLISPSVISDIIKSLFRCVRRVAKSVCELRHVGSSVRPSLLRDQFNSNWTDFRHIRYRRLLWKSLYKFPNL